MTPDKSFRRKILISWMAGLAIVVMTMATARADIVVYDKDQWTLSFDGRTSAFYSFETGDAYPHFTAEQIAANGGNPPTYGTPVWTQFVTVPDQNPDMCSMTGMADGQVCTFKTSRVHSGFVGNFFGLTGKKRISPTLTATARLSLWWPVETDQYRGWSSMSPDPRESYLKLEGSWGGLLVGRALGLHDRGGTQIDFLYANGNSVGSPCSATGQGPLCGFIGYGYQFPSFNASISYNTPLAGGFQWTVGAYDPAKLATGGATPPMENTPYPRIESEATFTYKGDKVFLMLFVNGMWQQASGFKTDQMTAKKVTFTRQFMGASYGGRLEIGHLKLGGVSNYDHGGGDYFSLAGLVPADNEGNLRNVTGYMGQALYSAGPVDLNAGFGLTLVQQSPNDVMDGNSVIKQRLGVAGTITYHVDSSMAFSLQYFHAEHTFWLGQIQKLDFVHAGAVFTW